MFISKKHIARRTVLKGIGATIGLPLLEAMIPAATAWAETPAGKTPEALCLCRLPARRDHGSLVAEGNRHELHHVADPAAAGAVPQASDHRLRPAQQARGNARASRLHRAGLADRVKPLDFGKAGPDSGVSADQIAVRYVGQETRLPSLELSVGQGSARIAWRTPTQSLPQESNPRAVFQKLFGQGDTDQERAQILAETGSILDRVQGQAQRLQASLGVKDRVIVGDYLDSVREIERRVQMAEKSHNSELTIPDAPVGTPNDITEYFKLMFDLMALAFQADITRVITLSMDREASMRTYTNLSIAEGFHPLSHHGNNPEKMDKLVQIQKYHTEVFAGFIKKIEAAKEADGTVLDHSTILFGSDMSNSDRHNNDPLPSAILGHANGKIKGGQHLKYPQDSRHGELLLTLLAAQ